MDFKVCPQCGNEIEGKGVKFQGQLYCSDECCDEFEAECATEAIPDLEELDGDEETLLEPDSDDLGYRDDDDLEDLDDDDFLIDDDEF